MKKSSVRNVYMLLWFIAFTAVNANNLQQMELFAMDEGNAKGSIILLGFFLISIPSIVLYKSGTLRELLRLNKWLVCFILLSSFATLINLTNGLKAGIYSLLCVGMPLLTYYIGYAHSREFGEQKWLLNLFFIAMLVLAAQYYSVYNYTNYFGESHLVSSYYMLFILPLVLLHPRKWLRYFALALCLAVLISSVKRAGFIAFSVAIFVYIIVQEKNFNHSRRFKIFQIVAMIAIAGGIIWYVLSTLDNRILERMADISDDGGSGRTEVWSTTWSMFCNQSFMHQLLGTGYNMVGVHSPLSLSAHNDLLEILYDYGLFSFVAFLFCWISIYKYSKKMYHEQSEVCPALWVLMSIYVCLGMMSIVVVFFWFTLLTFSIGYIYGLDQHHHNSTTYDELQ